MKITCARKDLYEGVKTVGRAIKGSSSWPILKNVLIRTSGERVSLTGYDLELGIQCGVPGGFDEAGALTANCSMLTELLGTLPDGDVSLSLGEANEITVCSGSSHYTLWGLPAEEYPTMPEEDSGTDLSLDQTVLGEAIKRTRIACSADSSRAILTGVLMEIGKKEVVLAATDTYRLAVETIRTKCKPARAVIVPKQALDELVRLIAFGNHNPVSIRIGEKAVVFEVGGVTVTSRLIEGEFPNYQRVIPGDFQGKVKMPTEDFLSRLRRAEIIAREQAFRVNLKTEADRLILFAGNASTGQAHEEMDVSLEGDGVEIGFNARFLSQFLAVVGSDEVTLQHNGSGSAGRWQGVGMDDYIYVQMPMQTA